MGNYLRTHERTYIGERIIRQRINMGIRKYKTPEIIHITKQQYYDKIISVGVLGTVLGLIIAGILVKVFA